MTIWKFAIRLDETAQVKMPQGARLLSVAMQHGLLCVWAVVEESAPQVTRTLYVRGTGHPLGAAQAKDYVGTAHDVEHAFVWHVFDGWEANAPSAVAVLSEGTVTGTDGPDQDCG